MRKIYVIGASVLLILMALTASGVSMVRNSGIDNSGESAESSSDINSGTIVLPELPFSHISEIPIEGCGLAGITIADMMAFQEEHEYFLNFLDAALINGGIEGLFEVALVIQGDKDDEIALSDDLSYLMDEFDLMVDCSQGDTDGDGIPDFEDEDDDGDGIPDVNDNRDVTRITIEKPNYIRLPWPLPSIKGTLYHFWAKHADAELIATAWDTPDFGPTLLFLAAGAVFGGPQMKIVTAAVLLQSIGELWLICEVGLGINPFETKDNGYGTINDGWVDEDETVAGLVLGTAKVRVKPQ